MSVPHGRRSLLLAGAAAVAAVTTAVAAVPAAHATTFPVGSQPQSFTLTGTVMTHTAVASAAQWSVAATDNIVTMNVRDAGGVIGRSGPAGFHSGSWVAIDQNPGRRPTGRYLLDVSSRSGGTGAPYRMQFLDGGASLTSGGTTQIGRPGGEWIVDLRQVRLHAGDTLNLAVQGSAVSAINVLHSDPARPSTWVQNDTAVSTTFWLNKPESTDVNTFTYLAPATGTYALVFERGWWDPTASVTSTIVPWWANIERKPIEIPTPRP